MKKLITTDITGAVGMPLKSGTLDHLQSAYAEINEAVAKGTIQSQYGINFAPNKAYVLYGLEYTFSISPISWVFSEGAVWYNGEVFLVPAKTFGSVSGSWYLQIQESFFTGTNADPVEFTDAVNRNVHRVRTMELFRGATPPDANLVIDYDNRITSPVQYINPVPDTSALDWVVQNISAVGSLINKTGTTTLNLGTSSIVFKRIGGACIANFILECSSSVSVAGDLCFFVRLPSLAPEVLFIETSGDFATREASGKVSIIAEYPLETGFNKYKRFIAYAADDPINSEAKLVVLKAAESVPNGQVNFVFQITYVCKRQGF
jgi:hypothetical protein